MKNFRINRLFHPTSRRCLDVAIDHGFFGEPSFLGGIEDMQHAVATVAAARPDAVQLTVGQAPLLQSLPGRDKPALVLRTDIANVYGHELPSLLFSEMIEDAVDQALRLDAACVVVNLFDIPGAPEVRQACIRNILKLKPLCDSTAMPLMIEPLVMCPADGGGGYGVDGDTRRIVTLVRQAVELGADIIKADPTDRIDDYEAVITVAGDAPVLVRGGGRVDDRTLLERTAAVLQLGASGIVYGRNIIQHPTPAGVTRALLAMLHDSASVDEALAIIEHEAGLALSGAGS